MSIGVLTELRHALTGIRYHTVCPGENLADISLHYYGTANHTLVIFQHNRDRVADPNRLHVGQRIVIPHIIGR